jgi:hypothetical protein
MDSHTISALNRLEVVETGRRRRWSEEEKARIVLESLSGPRLVACQLSNPVGTHLHSFCSGSTSGRCSICG